MAPSTTSSSAGAYRRYAEVYDLVRRATPAGRLADLCLEAAGRAAVAVRHVVDAACGTGDLALELARRGYQVTGFDLSRQMLARAAAKRRLVGARRSPDLVLGDLRAPPLAEGCADLVVALNGSLNYLLEADELVTAADRLGRLTGRDGAVVIEPLPAPPPGERPARRASDGDLRLEASYELHGDLLIERVSWTVDGIRETESYCQRYYDDERLEALLGAAGLIVADRLPLPPAIGGEPARDRVLWVAVR